jgi:hypothetical protein
MKKIIISLSILFFLFIPVFVNAQTDQRCFTKEQCVQARSDYSNLDADAGFVEKKECGKVPEGSVNGTAGELMGYCLPSTEAITQIKIGGKRNFAHIGDFLTYLYKYGVMIAGILATVMIIIAGLQWVASGGNSATVGKAKKRIFGAVIGLVLAVGSYTILETINPALVELRLPQVWMLNKIGLAPVSCENLDTGSKVALAISSAFLKSDAISSEKKAEIEQENLKKIDYSLVKPENTECGSKYFIEGVGDQTCLGFTCPQTNTNLRVCSPFDIGPNNTQISSPYCAPYQVGFRFSINSLMETLTNMIPFAGVFVNKLEDDSNEKWLDTGLDAFYVQPVCNDRNGKPHAYKDNEKQWGDDSNEQKSAVKSYKGSGFDTFEFFIGGQTNQSLNNTTSNIKPAYYEQHWCPHDHEIAGFYFAIELNKDWGPNDSLLWIGKGSQTPKVGTWNGIHDGGTFFTVEDLTKGIYLDVVIDAETLEKVLDAGKTWPTEQRPVSQKTQQQFSPQNQPTGSKI